MSNVPAISSSYSSVWKCHLHVLLQRMKSVVQNLFMYVNWYLGWDRHIRKCSSEFMVTLLVWTVIRICTIQKLALPQWNLHNDCKWLIQKWQYPWQAAWEWGRKWPWFYKTCKLMASDYQQMPDKILPLYTTKGQGDVGWPRSRSLEGCLTVIFIMKCEMSTDATR